MHLIRQKHTVNSVSYAHNEYHPKLQKRQKARIHSVLHLLLTQGHKTYLSYIMIVVTLDKCSPVVVYSLKKKFKEGDLNQILPAPDLMVSFTL